MPLRCGSNLAAPAALTGVQVEALERASALKAVGPALSLQTQGGTLTLTTQLAQPGGDPLPPDLVRPVHDWRRMR